MKIVNRSHGTSSHQRFFTLKKLLKLHPNETNTAGTSSVSRDPHLPNTPWSLVTKPCQIAHSGVKLGRWRAWESQLKCIACMYYMSCNLPGGDWSAPNVCLFFVVFAFFVCQFKGSSASISLTRYNPFFFDICFRQLFETIILWRSKLFQRVSPILPLMAVAFSGSESHFDKGKDRDVSSQRSVSRVPQRSTPYTEVHFLLECWT